MIPFLRRIKQVGPYQLLFVTEPGAGRIVSQVLSDAEWEDPSSAPSTATARCWEHRLADRPKAISILSLCLQITYTANRRIDESTVAA